MNEINGIQMQNMYPSDKLKILLLEKIAKALEKIAEEKEKENNEKLRNNDKIFQNGNS